MKEGRWAKIGQHSGPKFDSRASKALDHLDGIAGRQVGDPARGADAIIAAVEAPHPPLHLLLGSDALSRTQTKMEAMQKEMAAWQAVTTGTDFPGAAS